MFANNNSAVEVTKLCYDESTRNLMFKIQCGDLKDLQECVKVIGSYNDFSAKIIVPALEKFTKFKGVSYFIGREFSPVIYFDINWGWDEATRKDFEYEVGQFAEVSRADEFNVIQNEGIRLWWD
jgi:hypothetical protein